MIGLLWDRAPCQANAEIDAFIATHKDWLIVECIPGGLTSIIQVGDLIANAQLNADLKLWVAEWRCAQLRAMGWPAGHVVGWPDGIFSGRIQWLLRGSLGLTHPGA